MKKYTWFILITITIAVAIIYYFYGKKVYNYQSCIRAGGKVGHIMENGFCEINGQIYPPKLPNGYMN